MAGRFWPTGRMFDTPALQCQYYSLSLSLSLSLSFQLPCYLHFSLLCLSLFLILFTPALKAVVPSPSLFCMFDALPERWSAAVCFVCDIMALFSLLSQYSAMPSQCCFCVVRGLSCCHLCFFIFALSFGLSQRCCPPCYHMPRSRR